METEHILNKVQMWEICINNYLYQLSPTVHKHAQKKTQTHTYNYGIEIPMENKIRTSLLC